MNFKFEKYFSLCARTSCTYTKLKFYTHNSRTTFQLFCGCLHKIYERNKGQNKVMGDPEGVCFVYRKLKIKIPDRKQKLFFYFVVLSEWGCVVFENSHT